MPIVSNDVDSETFPVSLSRYFTLKRVYISFLSEL